MLHHGPLMAAFAACCPSPIVRGATGRVLREMLD
jgi:hypothetical protein